MSTKIYNGFQFPPCGPSGFSFILDWLKELHTELEPIATRLQDKAILDIAIENLDSQCRTRKKQNLSHPWGAAYREVLDRQKKIAATGYRDSEVDWDFSISVIPYEKGGIMSFLGLAYTEQEEFLKVLKSKHWFIDYAYWNNSDREKGVSKTAWEQRRRAWDKALGHDAPSERGYSFQVITHERLFPSKVADILHLQDSVEERAKRIAENILISKHLKAKGFKKESGLNEAMHEYMVFQRELREEGPASVELAAAVKKWTKKLKPVTIKDLFPATTGDKNSEDD